MMDTAAIAEALASVLDVDPASVADLRRLTGGASRETWSVSVDGRPLVLQRERPGTPRAGRMGIEGGLIEAAAAAGVPVPNVVERGGEESPMKTGFLVTDFIDAETIARKIIRDDRFEAARSSFAADCGQALARIHAVDPSTHDIPTQDPLGAVVDMYAQVGVTVPTFDFALRWLADNRPNADHGVGMVHGDFRLGNLMIDDDGLRAVIDWELAHVGDPISDLGWLCTRAWRFGGDGEVGGIGAVDDLLAAYEAESGRSVSREYLRWHEVLGSLRWGIMCIVQARAHLDGFARSVELAAIGRRVVENEYDLFLLIAPDAVDSAAAILDSASAEPAPTLDLWPPADQMLLAAEEFAAGLRDSVGGAVGFTGRVVENLMAMMRREHERAPAARDRSAARRRDLAESVGGADWIADDTSLAAAIADGRADSSDPGLVALLAEWALDRLRIVNPRYAKAAHRGDTAIA